MFPNECCQSSGLAFLFWFGVFWLLVVLEGFFLLAFTGDSNGLLA